MRFNLGINNFIFLTLYTNYKDILYSTENIANVL